MRVLGIETSCDETGIALYDSEKGLLAHALHSQVAMHSQYGGVVPELASRDHIRRIIPLIVGRHDRERQLGEGGGDGAPPDDREPVRLLAAQGADIRRTVDTI